LSHTNKFSAGMRSEQLCFTVVTLITWSEAAIDYYYVLCVIYPSISRPTVDTAVNKCAHYGIPGLRIYVTHQLKVTRPFQPECLLDAARCSPASGYILTTAVV
jgi:hypothetical protein